MAVCMYHNIIVVLMQQLKNQNGLLLQLVTGLQNQINSKNRQNQILFQQYDQLAQDNAALRTQIDNLRLKVKHFEQQIKPERKSETSIPSPKELATQDLKLKLESAQQEIKTLRIELEQKGGMIILLESQLAELKNQTPSPSVAPEPVDNPWKADLQTKIRELQQSLTMKQNTVNELTEYMNDQANKISELTRQSIATINNYEEKIEQKDKEIQELKAIAQHQKEEEQQSVKKEGQVIQTASHEEVTLLKEKISELQAMLSMKEQSISELSEFLQSQSLKLSNMQTQLSESKVTSLEKEISVLKQIIASKEQSMAELSQFLQTLSLKGGENDEKILAMQKQYEEAKLKWQEQKQSMKKEIQMIRVQFESKEVENDSLSEGQKLKSSPMIDQMHVKLSTKEDQVNRLNQIIQEKQLIIQELTQNAALLQTKQEEIQSNQDKETQQATLLELKESLEAKQKYIDEFSEYMNEQLANVKELTEKIKVYQENEAQGKLNDEELKLQLQRKDKTISQFTEYMNQQLKVVADLTERLKLYQQKEANIENPDHTIFSHERQQYELTIHELRQALQNKQRQIDEFSQYMNDQLKTVGQLTETIKHYQQQKLSKSQNHTQAEKLSSDERTAYEKTIAELQQKLHTKDKEIKELNSYIRDELNTVEQLTQKLEAFAEKEQKEQKEENEKKQSAQLQRQENQIIIFSQKIEQLQQILKSKEESLTEMSQFLEEYYLSKAKLEEDISNLQDQNSALKQQIQSLKDKAALQVCNTSESKPSNQLSAELSEKSQLQQQLVREISTIRQLKAIIQQKEEELTKLFRKIDEKDSDYRDLEQIITTKTQTIAELSSFMNEQSQRLAELQGLVQKYQSEKKEGLSSDIEASSENRNLAKDNISELKDKISILEKLLEEKNVTIAGLTELVQQRQQSINELQNQVNNKQAQQTSLATLTPEKVAQLQALIVNQGQTILLLKQQTQALESREEQLQNQLDNIQTQHLNLSEQNKRLKQQLQLLRESNQAAHKEQRSRRSSYGVREALKEEMGTLKEKILDLEETLQAKAETIKELSEYMNEQATKLVELESKELSKSGETQKSGDNNQKVNDLEIIIKSKEESIAELTEYLNDNYNKIQSLEQQVKDLGQQLKKATTEAKQFKSEPTIAQILKQQREESMLIELQRAVLQKKQILNQLELAIDEKELELSFIKNEIADERIKLQSAQCEKVEAQKTIKDFNAQKQELTQKVQKASRDQTNRESYPSEKKENFQQFFLEKEEEINSITEILQKLQEELRSKNQMIEYLEQSLKVQRAQKLSHRQLRSEAVTSENPKDQRIQELQAQVKTLREQHKELSQRLQKQQQHLILQQEYDIIGLEDEMKKQSQKYSNNLKQQMEQLKGSAKNAEKESVRALKESAERQQLSQLSQLREQRLTTTQLLSQLMLYSDEGANMRAIRVLIASLSQKYHRELVEYQSQSGQLKETVESLIELNQNLSLEVRNFRESLREKEHIIEELHEMNNQKEHSYQQKLEEIRQSLTILGSEVPNFLSKILEGKEQSPQRQSLKRQQKQSVINDRSPSRSALKEPQAKRLKDEIKELKDQIQKLREQSQIKDKELQQLRQLRTSKNKTYQRQLQDLLMDSNAKEDPSIQLEELQAEKERLASLCTQLEGRLSVSQREKKQQAATIEILNERISALERSPGGFALSAVTGGENQNLRIKNDISPKVLADLEENVPIRGKESEKSGWRQSNEVQEPSMESKMLEKDEIIVQLQQTILNLEKGFNDEIMELRRNIAELEAEVLSLRRHLYIADPNALDVAQLVRQTCTQQNKPTQFFKPSYKLRYTNNISNSFNYSPVQPLQNSSFYTQSKRNNYEPFYNTSNLTLGQKMMGRKIRQNYPLNLTINNQFKVQNTPWETSKVQQM